MTCAGQAQDLSGYLEPLIQHELSFLAEVDSAPDQHFYKPHVVRPEIRVASLPPSIHPPPPPPTGFQCNSTVPSVLDPVHKISLEWAGRRHRLRAAHGRAFRLALSHALATQLPRGSRGVTARTRYRP